ncbi:MAG: helix-turn-helix transcriptional regulator [Synergistaceae bacterium]|nr:helix-turn-helix transcriptional regulator [Synergistaceae bacterium]
MRLRELRERLGISQEELAERVGCHSNTIRRWELGRREPRSSDIQKLCEILNCTEAELLSVSVKQEFEVKILMGVKSLTGLAGVEVASNSFFYGVEDDEPQIVMGGRVRIDTPELRAKARELILKKFDAACRMFDLKDKIEAEA